MKWDLLLNAAAQGVWRGPVPLRGRRIPRAVATPFPYMPVMCVTSILTSSTRSLVRFAYSAAMADDSWKDARVRQAEEALAHAVRTADEIIAEAQRAVAPPASPEPPGPSDPPEDGPRPILRDAW